MVQDAMFLALGFCMATLLALATLPVVWARALRLSQRRLEMLVPLSIGEIQAERDGIRAEAAVTQRRLEQKLDRARQASATVAAELGRRTTSLVVAESVADALRAERATLIGELAALSANLRDAEGQRAAAEKALHDADAAIETAGVDRRARIRAAEALDALAEERRGTIAALETRNDGLRAGLADRDAEIEQLTRTLADLRTRHAAAARERDLARNEVALAATHRAMLEAELKTERTRATDQHRQLLARTEALAATEQRLVDMQADKEASARAFAALKQRFDALQEKLVAALPQGATPTVSDDELARLRQAIVDVADDALVLLAPQKAPVEDDAQNAGAQP